MARPSDYTQEIADLICDRISQGEMLTKVCAEEGMPPRKTVYTWMRARPDFKAAYARAREEWAEFYEEKVLDIAFDDKGDFFIEDGKAVADHARVARARLQVDTLKWFMMKWAPRRYGETPELVPESAGITRIERTIIASDGDAERLALLDRIQELEEQLGLRAPAPKRLTFDPGPLPSRLDGEIVSRLVGVIRSRVPQADQREPAAVLDELMSIIDRALAAEYEATADASSEDIEPASL